MPKEAFTKLTEEKRNKIITASKQEFIDYGYQNASTNRIVKNCNISKGSLFYYFEDKEDLYLYLVELARSKFSSELKQLSHKWSSDILERIKIMTETGLILFERYPLDYQLLMTFNETESSSLKNDYLKQIAETERVNFKKMFEDVDTSNFNFDLDTTLQVISWFYLGLKTDISLLINKNTNPSELRKEFMEKLEVVLESLKKGIYKNYHVK